MAKWRINTLSPQEIAKYRQRSVRAINGLDYCKQNAHIIAQYRKVSDKYKILANYMGLAQEGGNSYGLLCLPYKDLLSSNLFGFSLSIGLLQKKSADSHEPAEEFFI